MTEGPLPPLTAEEYAVAKELLDDFEAVEQRFNERTGRTFRSAEAEELRDFDDFRAMLRASVEGYEAANPDAC